MTPEDNKKNTKKNYNRDDILRELGFGGQGAKLTKKFKANKENTEGQETKKVETTEAAKTEIAKEEKKPSKSFNASDFMDIIGSARIYKDSSEPAQTEVKTAVNTQTKSEAAEKTNVKTTPKAQENVSRTVNKALDTHNSALAIDLNAEEKVELFNQYLPDQSGFNVHIIPNNRTDWKNLDYFTKYFPTAFNKVIKSLKAIGVSSSDMILAILTQEGGHHSSLYALVFGDECLYQISSDNSWKVPYNQIEDVSIVNGRISLVTSSRERKSIIPLNNTIRTQSMLELIEKLVEGEHRRQYIIMPNTQTIEKPKTQLTPYYVMASGLMPGDSIICRTSTKLANDNYMNECTYISQARKLKVCGKTGKMLYVEIVQGCYGWVSAAFVKKDK